MPFGNARHPCTGDADHEGGIFTLRRTRTASHTRPGYPPQADPQAVDLGAGFHDLDRIGKDLRPLMKYIRVTKVPVDSPEPGLSQEKIA